MACVSDTSLVNVVSSNSGLAVGVVRDGSVGRVSDWDSLTTGPEQEVIRGVAMAGFDVSHYAVGCGAEWLVSVAMFSCA